MNPYQLETLKKFLAQRDNPLLFAYEDFHNILDRLPDQHKKKIWLAFSSEEDHERDRIRSRIRLLGFMDQRLIDECNADEVEAAKAAKAAKEVANPAANP